MKARLARLKYFAATLSFQALHLVLVCCVPLSHRTLFVLIDFVSIVSLVLVHRTQRPGAGDAALDEMCCVRCLVADARYSHCAVCDVCVLLRDHHCVWMNTCIGAHNRVFFVLYLASTTCVLCALLRFARDAAVRCAALAPALLFAALLLYHGILAVLGIRSVEFVKVVGKALKKSSDSGV